MGYAKNAEDIWEDVEERLAEKKRKSSSPAKEKDKELEFRYGCKAEFSRQKEISKN